MLVTNFVIYNICGLHQSKNVLMLKIINRHNLYDTYSIIMNFEKDVSKIT